MGKCKHWKYCKFYKGNSETCNKNSGGYYGSSFGVRPAGCYFKIEETIRKNKLARKNRGE